MEPNETKNSDGGNTIVLERLLNAPRELVFDVWTDPTHIARWWGPNGFTSTVEAMNVTPGGVWKFTMQGPDGVVYPNVVRYKEIVRPEKLVYHHSDGNEEGEHSFNVTVTFEEQGSKTLLTMRSEFRSAAVRDMLIKQVGAVEKGYETLAHLAEHLEEVAAEENLVIEREVNAPRAMVYKAWTDAAQLAKWWGPKGCTLKVVQLNTMPGGIFHYGMEVPGMPTMYGRFTYRELREPEYLAFVSGFADAEGNIAPNPWMPDWPLETWNEVTLTEHDGKTLLRIYGRPINATQEQRRLYLQMHQNMQEGFAGTFQKLDELLAAG